MKEIMSFTKGRNQVAQGGDRNVSRFLQLSQPNNKLFGAVNKQGPVRTKSRVNGRRKTRLSKLNVKPQIVHWIVGRTQRRDAELFQNALGGQFIATGNLLVALIPDRFGVRFAKQIIDVEKSF